MFSQFIGNYLIENKVITLDNFNSIMRYQDEHRVKLGTIAIAEGLLTQKQTDEINNIQATKDMRFGDIAISKGYLTSDDIDNLLRLQESPHLIFLQALEEIGIMNQEEFAKYVDDFQKIMHMTNSDLNALKNSDIEDLIPLFTKNCDQVYTNAFGIILKNITRFVTSHFLIEEGQAVSEYSAKSICLQRFKGDMSGFIMLASDTDSLLPVASGCGKWNYTEMDEDACDSICEFINCCSGLFASANADKDINLELLPPESYTDSSFKSVENAYIMPVYVNRKRFDIIIGTSIEIAD